MSKNEAIRKRLAALDDEIRQFEQLANDAAASEQFGPAATAKHRASGLRRERDDILAALEADAYRDPVRRLELHQTRAAAAGSWVAVTQLGRQIEEARARAAAEAARKEEEARRKRTPAEEARRLNEAIRRMPPDLRRLVLEGLGSDASSEGRYN